MSSDRLGMGDGLENRGMGDGGWVETKSTPAHIFCPSHPSAFAIYTTDPPTTIQPTSENPQRMSFATMAHPRSPITKSRWDGLANHRPSPIAYYLRRPIKVDNILPSTSIRWHNCVEISLSRKPSLSQRRA